MNKNRILSVFTVFACCWCAVVGIMVPKVAKASTGQEYAEQAMKCFMGKCGHVDAYVTNLNSVNPYYVVSRGVEYESLGRYVDPGNSATISESIEYSSSISSGLEVGIGVCKISLGISGSLTKGYSYTDTLNNNENYRRYVHAGVEYEERVSNGIKVERRIFNPFWNSSSLGRCCEYDETIAYPRARVPRAAGYSLLACQIYSANITQK